MSNEKNNFKEKFSNSKKFNNKKDVVKTKESRLKVALDEIESIYLRLDKETPPCGFIPTTKDIIESNETTPINIRPKIAFKDLAISNKTQKGLIEDKKFKMTPIQRAAIPHALYNRDILGASKTGSGKTLAFVIPLLEKLYLNRWSSLDGLGALIIVPNRLLAIGIFEVLKTIGKFHDFSLGLAIGGNNVEKEQQNIASMNIVVGTVGRILHHITETPDFNADNLKVLVVDEADKILDEGFEKDLTEILSYLPKEKQTMLFSATLRKDIKQISKFNLKCPELISINNIENLTHFNNEEKTNQNTLSTINLNLKGGEKEIAKEKKEEKNDITPKNLHQYYNLIECHLKINTLYSFLNTHKNNKIIVFLSTCKQVRFYYESFKRMKLGFTFFELHGGQKQSKRTAIFYTFLEKTNCVLFATDIASRGLDFPSVNWVIQVDCPEDMETYIHRVGRTARYKSQGSSLLFITPSELNFISLLNKVEIEIQKIKVNKDKVINLQPILRSILSENKDILYLAQKAIVTYVKSIAFQKNKQIFNLDKYDIGELALSYGLMSKPTIIVNKNKAQVKIKDEDDEVDADEPEKESKIFKLEKSRLEKFKEKIKQKKLLKKDLTLPEKVDVINTHKDDDFLLSKKRNLTNVHTITAKAEKKNTPIEIDYKKIEDRYSKIKDDLKLKEDEFKLYEKERVKNLHKQQRVNQKKEDYEKHNLYEDNNEEDEIEEEEKIEIENKHNKKISSKENIALNIISQKKGKLLF